jgi:DNA-binding HxlR family transcriptional regulator
MSNADKYLKAITVLGDKHVLGIVKLLLNKDERFCEIERGLKLNPITLTTRLRKLEDADMVWRSSGTFNKLSVVYGLTDKGKKLRAVIKSIEAISQEF